MAKPKRTWVFEIEVTLKSGVIITRRMKTRADMVRAYELIRQNIDGPSVSYFPTKRGDLALSMADVVSVSTDAWMTNDPAYMGQEIPW